MGRERREGRGGERRGQKRRVGGREGRVKEGGNRKERGGKGKREGDAPLTQIPGSAPGAVDRDAQESGIFSKSL